MQILVAVAGNTLTPAERSKPMAGAHELRVTMEFSPKEVKALQAGPEGGDDFLGALERRLGVTMGVGPDSVAGPITFTMNAAARERLVRLGATPAEVVDKVRAIARELMPA